MKSVPTKNLSDYIKKMDINLSKMARDTSLPYMALYDSLINDSRDRDLRVGEFFLICKFLEVDPRIFADKKGVI